MVNLDPHDGDFDYYFVVFQRQATPQPQPYALVKVGKVDTRHAAAELKLRSFMILRVLALTVHREGKLLPLANHRSPSIMRRIVPALT